MTDEERCALISKIGDKLKSFVGLGLDVYLWRWDVRTYVFDIKMVGSNSSANVKGSSEPAR